MKRAWLLVGSFDLCHSSFQVYQKLKSLKGLLSHQALSIPYYESSSMQAWIDTTIAKQKIKQALIYSMHNAPIVAVRLKSMEGLMKYKIDPELSERENYQKLMLTLYEFLDENPLLGESQYRLKRIDSDYEPMYSSIVNINCLVWVWVGQGGLVQYDSSWFAMICLSLT